MGTVVLSVCELVIAYSSSFQESVLEYVFGVRACHTELLAARKEYEESLSLVRTEAEGRHQHEMESLRSRYEEEADKMRASLSERAAKLLEIQADLERVKSAAAEREETLGSAVLNMEGVRQQLAVCQVELRESKQQKDKLQSEIEHLKVRYTLLWLSVTYLPVLVAIKIYFYVTLCVQ